MLNDRPRNNGTIGHQHLFSSSCFQQKNFKTAGGHHQTIPASDKVQNTNTPPSFGVCIPSNEFFRHFVPSFIPTFNRRSHILLRRFVVSQPTNCPPGPPCPPGPHCPAGPPRRYRRYQRGAPPPGGAGRSD